MLELINSELPGSTPGTSIESGSFRLSAVVQVLDKLFESSTLESLISSGIAPVKFSETSLETARFSVAGNAQGGSLKCLNSSFRG